MTTHESSAPAQLAVLISGASFAGLSTAFWMQHMGHKVTIVEIGDGLKAGGTPVDIRGSTVEIVKRMGLFEKIRSRSLPQKDVNYKDASGATIGQMNDDGHGEEDCEIEREVLLQMLLDLVKPNATIVFSDSIVSLIEHGDRVDVGFRHGSNQTFDLVFGCDGVHSTVRKYWFGEESQFTQFLGGYFSITTTDGCLIEQDTTEIYNEPGQAVMLNAYNGKTDIVFCFSSDEEIEYDYRNESEQRQIVNQRFERMGGRAAEFLQQLLQAKDFYFDKFCQVKMSSWTRGRVALVGDAAYCASPAAGMGGSLAMHGAAAVADAFRQAEGDLDLAFRLYDANLRPFIDDVQASAVDFIKEFLPPTQEAISARNSGANQSSE